MPNLYTLTRQPLTNGPVTVWRYTDGDATETHAGNYYTPAPLRLGTLSSSRDSVSSVTIDSARDFPPIADWLATAPTGTTTITVADGDTLLFVGRVAGVEFSGSGCSITCYGTSRILQDPVLVATYGSTCRHALYSTGCGVSQLAHVHVCQFAEYDGIALVVEGVTLTPGQLTGGLLVAAGETYTIASATVDAGDATISTLLYVPGLTAGQYVTLLPGCAHDLPACTAYNNTVRFGGFPLVPATNPFNKEYT